MRLKVNCAGLTGSMMKGAALLGLALIAGCGAGNFGYIPPTPVPPVQPTPPVPPVPPYSGPTFTARVLAGTTPIPGATVQFYAAGTSGNGSAATALLTSAVTTDTTGAAAVPANYTCPASSAMTYVVATGATAGNSKVTLMSALGPCSGVTAGSTSVINEVTTVAAAYALAPFYRGGQIGASATNLQGITNAFLTASSLANVSMGSSSGTALPANAMSPAARVNTLANVLNACVVKSANCAALYAAGSATPATTLDAVVGLAQSPANNVMAVYAEAGLSTAYAPVLASMPVDWTMFINYTGGGMTSPSGVAVDSTGTVWVSSYFNTASRFSTIGEAAFPNGISGYGLNHSYGISIDLNNNVWIPNEEPYSGGSTIGSVTELNSAGMALSGAAGYTAGGMNYPTSTAVDSGGTVWVVQYGNSRLTQLNQSGVPLSGPTGFQYPSFGFPISVVVDDNRVAWVGDQEDSTITRVAADGSSALGINCCAGPAGIAVDAKNNIWATNFYSDSVSLISNAGQVISAGGFKGNGSMYRPQSLAIDGGGSVFIANYRNPNITVLAGSSSANPGASISPAAGYGADAGIVEGYSLAIDASGNVWVTNQGTDQLTKFIGLAVPVKTPVSGAVKLP